jgi:hypothetical protein
MPATRHIIASAKEVVTADPVFASRTGRTVVGGEGKLGGGADARLFNTRSTIERSAWKLIGPDGSKTGGA